jgi:hypothetical protein
MKNKSIFIVAATVLLLVFVGLKIRGKQTSVTPGSLVTPTEEVSPVAMEATPKTTGVVPTIAPSTKMTLSVSSPSNGATVSNASLTVRGKTKAGAEVFVNELETKADANGDFSVSITLDEGENYIIIMANDADGNVAESELTVTYSS